MLRAGLQCVVCIVLGFGVGRWLSVAIDSTKRNSAPQPMNLWMNRDRPTAETWLDAQADLPWEWVSEWKAIKPLP